MIIIHHNDLDGRCAAAIVYTYVATSELNTLIEMDYAKPMPWHLISPNETVWIVDFSLSVADMEKLHEITTNITWIDHHVTAIEKFKGWPTKIRGIRNGGEAACVLTWKYVRWWTIEGVGPENFGQGCTGYTELPQAVAMIGDYDAWHHQITDSTAFYEGMKMRPQNPKDPHWLDLFRRGEKMCPAIISDGKAAIEYRDAYCIDMCNSFGFETEIDGVQCYFTNIYKFGSLGFAGRMKVYPICAAGVFDGKKWTISLYSDNQVDVSKICQNHGGGGHKGAAGFVTETFPFVRKL